MLSYVICIMSCHVGMHVSYVCTYGRKRKKTKSPHLPFPSLPPSFLPSFLSCPSSLVCIRSYMYLPVLCSEEKKRKKKKRSRMWSASHPSARRHHRICHSNRNQERKKEKRTGGKNWIPTPVDYCVRIVSPVFTLGGGTDDCRNLGGMNHFLGEGRIISMSRVHA